MTEQYPKLHIGNNQEVSPKTSTLQAILSYSKSVEVKKKGQKKVIIHLN